MTSSDFDFGSICMALLHSLTWQPALSPLRHVSYIMLSQHQHCSPQHSPSGLSPAVWLTLPIKLITQILLYVAFASHIDAYALCLASSAVRCVVLPVLCHNVLLRHATQLRAFVLLFATSTTQYSLRYLSSSPGITTYPCTPWPSLFPPNGHLSKSCSHVQCLP